MNTTTNTPDTDNAPEVGDDVTVTYHRADGGTTTATGTVLEVGHRYDTDTTSYLVDLDDDGGRTWADAEHVARHEPARTTRVVRHRGRNIIADNTRVAFRMYGGGALQSGTVVRFEEGTGAYVVRADADGLAYRMSSGDIEDAAAEPLPPATVDGGTVTITGRTKGGSLASVHATVGSDGITISTDVGGVGRTAITVGFGDAADLYAALGRMLYATDHTAAATGDKGPDVWCDLCNGTHSGTPCVDDDHDDTPDYDGSAAGFYRRGGGTTRGDGGF